MPDSGRYGRVEVRAWHGLHQRLQGRGHFGSRPQPAAVPGTVIQVIAERLPDGRAPQGAMWLWWAAPPGTPCDLDMIWRAYLRRFDAEHGFRFEKGTLGWTCARVRTPAQADLWTWLILAAYTQLHLARRLAPDLRRPWERPPPPGRELSPARVRRGFRHIRGTIGTPARGPKPSRPGPGLRNVGRNSGRPPASVLMSGQCPRIAPDSTQPTWMMRARACASGRNNSVEQSATSKISGSAATALRTSASRLPCVISQPFGRPVVPEV